MSESEETYSDGDTIKCPSCGHVISHLGDYELGEDDSTVDECESCESKVEIVCRVSVSYKATVKS